MFKIYEYQGYEVYLSEENAQQKIPIFDYSALQPGQTLYADYGTAGGVCRIGTVATLEDGKPYIDAGPNAWGLSFSKDDRACWVASCCWNAAAISRINFTP